MPMKAARSRRFCAKKRRSPARLTPLAFAVALITALAAAPRFAQAVDRRPAVDPLPAPSSSTGSTAVKKHKKKTKPRNGKSKAKSRAHAANRKRSKNRKVAQLSPQAPPGVNLAPPGATPVMLGAVDNHAGQPTQQTVNATSDPSQGPFMGAKLSMNF